MFGVCFVDTTVGKIWVSGKKEKNKIKKKSQTINISFIFFLRLVNLRTTEIVPSFEQLSHNILLRM